MDGVLVNNLEVHREAFAEFFRRYGVERSFDELSRVFGKGNDDIMGELMPRDVVERVGIRELGHEKEAIYREIYAPTITPQPGLLTFLDECEAEGYYCAVAISNLCCCLSNSSIGRDCHVVTVGSECLTVTGIAVGVKVNPNA